VSGDEPTTEELRLRQLEEERTQLRGLDDARTEAEAEIHLRRADKAGYLRQKVEEQQRADRDADA
jgi:5'-deoxynucleotidase YfbR-like HD superfamily hydrolase